ncbi:MULTISPECIES: penicillin-binding transpeptidase domain-containing protein [Streptomyces]|uniref:Penicillin binding protein n=1 Tax=Streptomyces gancidicus BKS 13-15 TaxID=1284664 RepID=M3BRU3_STREZ|nr:MULTISPECIES: penicillin-binding transpeptidase domain-containing protein [Streptomyces]EMF26624.1 penicillin binding protein [Streptomyces gancidicus BKS 13-15]MCI4142423.1 penicillin-binding protein [Streptomyces sp. MMS20-AI2-20]
MNTFPDLSPSAPRRGPRTAVKALVAVTAVAAVAVGGAWGAGLGPFAGESGPDPEAVAEARAFLADWAAGRLPAAAARTTRPDRAEEVLSSFTSGLDIDRPVLTAGRPVEDEESGGHAVTVPYTARMPVTGLGTWTYGAELPLRERDGEWKVDWRLSLVHPRLSGTEKFRLEREEAEPVRALDRAGRALSADAHPSLGPVLAQLARGRDGGGPRGAVLLVDRATGDVRRTEAAFGGPARRDDGPLRTTLDARWQSAAEQALRKAGGKNAALVALRVADGQVLAVANSPADGFDRAVSGTYAPGSTWKIVTSGALLLKGAVAPDDVVDCPRYLTVGKRFQNVETSAHPGATFRTAFTESCNTAFIGLRDRLGDGELGEVAKKYFGVGQTWHVGVPSYDGSVPEPRDATEKAASMIGQGRVQANPLIMASVTATAVSGRFHQPSLVATGTEDTTVTEPLPPRVVSRLRSLLRATVTEGTARVLAPLGGEVGGKTGTAEVSEEQENNGWMVAHRGGVAVACVVEEGVTGGGSAGPVVYGVLSGAPRS